MRAWILATWVIRSAPVALIVLALGVSGAQAAGANSSLAQTTGLSASRVTAENVCPAVAPGYVQCAAEVLRLRRGGRLVRPSAPHPRVSERAGRIASDVSAPAQAPPAPDTPAYLQEAYDLSYLSASAGGSDTVAVVDTSDYPTAAQDLATFRADTGLPPCTAASGCFRKVNEQGAIAPLPAANSGWNVEEATDLDAVSSLCPNCRILLVEANSSSWSDMVAAMGAAAKLGANQISDSWTSSDTGQPPGQITFPGVSVVAATGDSGYQGTGESVYPAAAAGVVAAGGTSLDSAATLRGFAETAWSDAGSGCDQQAPKPAFQSAVACPGRAYADVSADADPNTGLAIYDSGSGGWLLAGGTSLSSPLVAAFEAVTGVNGTTPAWAYADSAVLNDPATGSNGSCSPAISEICVAGAGYDGPTGAGSISGQVAGGAPGIGGADVAGAGAGSYTEAVGSSTASLIGGVYPNGSQTKAWWQYGTTTAYGSTSSPVEIGAGTAEVAVAGALSGLAPSTGYHYRLVAQNGDGTSYGYDYTLTTPAGSTAAGSPPVNTAPPRVTGVAVQSKRLTASAGSWSQAGSLRYTWELYVHGRWTAIPGANSARYVPTAADVGHRLRVLVTETTPAGQSSGTSASSKKISASRAARLRAARAARAGGRGRDRRRRRSDRGR